MLHIGNKTIFTKKMAPMKKDKIVTDLDQSDTQIPIPIPIPEGKYYRGRDYNKKKYLNKFSENFSLRSRSAEWNLKEVPISDLHSLLQAKDKQMENLIQKVIMLYKYNNQFAKENKKLMHMLQKAGNPIECSTCKRLGAEKDSILDINKTLQNDISMMKILVYRLNVQIECYQEKLSGVNTNPDKVTSCNDFDKQKHLVIWGSVNSETLGPLLNSYEEMIKDKDDLIKQHENELQYFTSELKKIIDENLQLQEECDLVKKSLNGWLETKTRLQTQVNSLNTKLDVQTRRADMAKEKLLEVIQCYEQKTQGLSLDLEHLQTAYSRCKNELLSIKSSKSGQPDEIVESIKECRMLFEELKSQHSKEKLDWVSKLDELKEQNEELRLKNVELENNQETLKKDFNIERCTFEELKQKTICLQKISEKLKKSRDRLKARLKIALHWAHKLEHEQSSFEKSLDAVKRLETIVKHKEAQMRGLHTRHLEEMEKMKQRLQHKEDTIKNILKSKVNV